MAKIMDGPTQQVCVAVFHRCQVAIQKMNKVDSAEVGPVHCFGAFLLTFVNPRVFSILLDFRVHYIARRHGFEDVLARTSLDEVP